MICGFKKVFPWGEPTYFKEKILAPNNTVPVTSEEPKDFRHLRKGDVAGQWFFRPKIHTIREGERWRPGLIIHCCHGVRSKHYEQFYKTTVESVQKIELTWHNGPAEVGTVDIRIDGKLRFIIPLEPTTVPAPEYSGYMTFIQNDGFATVEAFLKWFNKDFTGQVIHWTGLKY